MSGFPQYGRSQFIISSHDFIDQRAYDYAPPNKNAIDTNQPPDRVMTSKSFSERLYGWFENMYLWPYP